jgi:hypothetical protein
MMQFKHPEILYALLLLIIPIIIHLFQLQRFQKVLFTNVKFLKQIELQTRKSSRLKKWLILLTRLLAFTSIIFAFAEPYFSNFKKNQEHNTIIYLDNSMSMESRGERGELLKNAVQDIIENSTSTSNVSLITNDKIYRDLNSKDLKTELLNIVYSSNNQDFKTILLKSEQLKSNKTNTLNNLMLISDFQSNLNINNQDVTNINASIKLVRVAPEKIQNISLDSIYIAVKNNNEITLKVNINTTNISSDNAVISLFDDSILIGKASTPLIQNQPSTVEFKISSTKKLNGKLVIDDENLLFDNTLFFTINESEKINIVSIGKSAPFLEKIYSKNEFNFEQKNLSNFDYNSIQNQNLIILNELNKIPPSLNNSLNEFVKNGGNIAIIPSRNSNLISYNSFFKNLNLGDIQPMLEKELKITTINFAHPLLSEVFEKQVKNFQYPINQNYYPTSLNFSSSILSFENKENFISEIKKSKGTIYWFASPLNIKSSNFVNSPLIVPIFYNFGKQSYRVSQLYYTLSDENNIEVKTSIKKDEVLKITGESIDFIPLQEVAHNKVRLTTFEQPVESGFYKITNNNKTIKNIAFNYNRQESELIYEDLKSEFKNMKNVTISDSVKETFTELKKQRDIKLLFKWFLGMAVLFLLLEIFILKFFKV